MVVLACVEACAKASTNEKQVVTVAVQAPTKMMALDMLSWIDDGTDLKATFCISNNSNRPMYFISNDDCLADAVPRADWELLSQYGWRLPDPWFFENGNQIMILAGGQVCACELLPQQRFEFAGSLNKTRIGDAREVRLRLLVADDDSDGFKHGEYVYSPSLTWKDK
jgi:hypothetical protein